MSLRERARERTKFGGTSDKGHWPLVLSLFLAVLLPTTGVLWFMIAAVRNERLAVRQTLTSVYSSQLARVSRKLDRYWSSTFWEEVEKTLASLAPADHPSATFGALLGAGLADAVILQSDSGVLYPSSHEPSPAEFKNHSEWRSAERLEYVERALARAAQAYRRIFETSRDEQEKAQALQAVARCLVGAREQSKAIEVLTKELGAYPRAVGSDGALIYPFSLFYALTLLEDSSSDDYGRIRAELVSLVADVTVPMPSSQRRFLMTRLQETGVDLNLFPTLAAETLAARYLAQDTLPRAEARLRPAGLDDVWQVASPDLSVVILLRANRIDTLTRPVIAAEVDAPEVTVALEPSSRPAGRPSLVATTAGTTLPGWRLSLRHSSSDPFGETAERRVALYLWTGLLVVIAIAVAAALVVRVLGRQMRLTRLKNDLLATVSHELKTPLASTRALVDTLIEGRCASSEQRHEYLELIAGENERLSRLIDNFLSFSRMEQNKRTFEFARVSIGQIVEGALDAVRKRLQTPRCHLEVDIESDLPPVDADEDALVTVLVNLLDNGLKNTGEDKQIVVRALHNDGSIQLEVEDNGTGISKRDTRRIFERFYQVNQSLSRETGGCGLGLSIVDFIVKAHGGSVDVVSKPGKGSTFRVVLPAAEVPDPVVQSAPGSEASDSASDKSIGMTS